MDRKELTSHAGRVSTRFVAWSRWPVRLIGIALSTSAALAPSACTGQTGNPGALADRAAAVSGRSSGSAQPEAELSSSRPPTAVELAANWPRFRGPGGVGVVRDADVSSYPHSWDGPSGSNILWKTVIPMPGNNSAIVWVDGAAGRGRIFCTGATDSRREVYCLDAESGRMLWHRQIKDVSVARDSHTETLNVVEETGFAASTAVTDGQRVYAIFASGDLVAYDFEGNRVWAKALGQPQNNYGYATSLAMYENLLLVQFDQGTYDQGLSALLAIDGATGQQVWKAKREVAASWASPMVIDTGTKTQLITLADPWVTAYDPRHGTELWRSQILSGDVAPSPAFDRDTGMLFVVSPSDRLMALRCDGSGDVTNTHVVWEMDDAVPDIVSPLVAGRFVYVLTTYGTLTCSKVKDGSVVWRHEYDDMTFHASPTLVGDRIYLTDTQGVTVIIKAGDQYEEIGRGALGEGVASCPAFVRGRIYVRARRHLYCIGGSANRK